MLVYGDATSNPKLRFYSGATNSLGTEAPAITGNGPQALVNRAAPNRREHLVGYLTLTGQLYILRWNGSIWSEEWNVAVGGNGDSGIPFDIAYENTTGRGMVVYSNNSTGVNELRYNLWNGTSWTGPLPLDYSGPTGSPS